MVDLGFGWVFAGKENILNLPGKCKPEDEFGKYVVTSGDSACSAVRALLFLAVGL